jgi:CubicO group peptidase (beta-lactamase class C family)
MGADFAAADRVMRAGLERVFPAAQLTILHRGQTALSAAYGWLDPETRTRQTRPSTLFDLASVSKLFAVTTCMALVEEGALGLDQPVCDALPELAETRPVQPYEDPLAPGAWVQVVPPEATAPVDGRRVTYRHLLAHNSGLPAWRPLYKEVSAEAARHMALGTFFSYPTGERVIYSDIGLILLGLAVERLTGLSLDQAAAQRVTAPLGLRCTGYLPMDEPLAPPDEAAVQVVAPTEMCAWRRRRVAGQVHDENAARLGGVAGHAGIFSTAGEVARFGQAFLDASGLPLKPKTVVEMRRIQAQDGDIRRGLGFALWSPDPEASSNPFSQEAFGHTGFTGTSLWVDPKRDLVVSLMTNRVYYGREAGGIIGFRVALHRAIVEVVDA